MKNKKKPVALEYHPAGNLCSKLTTETLEQGVKLYSNYTLKTPERRHWRQ